MKRQLAWLTPLWRVVAAVLACALTLTSLSATADDFPSRPIRFISPYSVGGGNDVAGRIMATTLSPRLGQPIVFENKTGAVGIIATEYVAKSSPDGYTLLWATGDNLTIVPALKNDTPYNVSEDFTYIARVGENDLTYVISSKLPVKNMREFIAYAKANPDKVRFGSAGIGGASHMAVELFMKSTGVKMQHIPYKGIGQAMIDVLGGQIEFSVVTPVSISPYLNSDKVRIIGLAGRKRHPLIPDVPTMAELGYPQATVNIWYALLGPAKMPTAVTEKLRKEVASALADPVVREKLETGGLTIAPFYGAEFQKSTIEEFYQWREIAKAQGIVLN